MKPGRRHLHRTELCLFGEPNGCDRHARRDDCPRFETRGFSETVFYSPPVPVGEMTWIGRENRVVHRKFEDTAKK